MGNTSNHVGINSQINFSAQMQLHWGTCNGEGYVWMCVLLHKNGEQFVMHKRLNTLNYSETSNDN